MTSDEKHAVGMGLNVRDNLVASGAPRDCSESVAELAQSVAIEMAKWKDEQYLKLWHLSDNEQPDGSRAVLIYDNSEGYAVGCYSTIRHNHQWAYIDELIPPKVDSVAH